ncbi:kynureninase [Erythrobacter litoralis]|uniref:Kynureninase n=1 Tax=Erythrobacter litoralis (strain HTCC2594) TaxID=314225 RepID=Q2N5W9_ERYLH|nr:kynureninase [Erythrobacter litoralis]ABC64922.1 kynureninase, putative [Erythrobacter litoralis HTCC2594]
MLDKARELDAADELAHFRDRFEIPEGVIYLDGNSLGALPKATPARLEQVMRGEWGKGLIRSWNDADWITLPQRVGGKIAPLIGAHPHEVIVADSVSVNLFKLISAALKMRPGRKVILSEPGNFPTDLYMIQGLESQGLATQRLAEREAIIDALDEDVALLLLTHVHYKSGAMFDMAALTEAAHDAGALVLWDLSHTGGALPVDLNGCGADFAVGCGYKYLNGGPGAPAYAFVAERHHEALEQPLSGWMGHAAPFAFTDDYSPAPGVDRLLCGTAPILSVSALEVGVDLIAEIGVDHLWAKSRALSEFLLECLAEAGVINTPSLLQGRGRSREAAEGVGDAQTETSARDAPAPEPPPLKERGSLALVSPIDPMQRGSQLSFRHQEAYALCQALIARGIIGDFRAPDILRLGFAPAYLRFKDMARTAEELADILAKGAWDTAEFKQRAAVT